MGNSIIGVGAFLPEKQVTNDDLAKSLDTNNEWIIERTGIETRHIAKEDEYTSTLAAKAALEAIKQSGIDARDIDLIVLATSTPDESLPATATRVQSLIGAINATSFDINAACGGFVYALHIADNLMKASFYKNALVIGAETMSRVVDWNDRKTAILFGDGAGAVLLQKDENKIGIIDSIIKSNGDYGDLLSTNGGVSKGRIVGNISMEGKEVFRHAVEKMSSAVEELLKKNNFRIDDIDMLIPHQANARIIGSCGKKLGIIESKVALTVSKHANTSAASIPLALKIYHNNGTIKKGDLVALTALGAGFTWGGALIRWEL
jgi:3-oxoacyl-[acyl-carrier-protein] synthase-3